MQKYPGFFRGRQIGYGFEMLLIRIYIVEDLLNTDPGGKNEVNYIPVPNLQKSNFQKGRKSYQTFYFITDTVPYI